MSIFDIILCVLFTTLASSYAWGMRGTVIGGEKGAMLPGAFIGLILALFSGGAIKENFFFLSSAGLMGMTFGGTEPYGETIGMVLHHGKPDYNPKKGYTGLAFKGALWFSVCGGFIAIILASMTGEIYSGRDLLLFMLLVPAIQRIGYNIFNQPYSKEKGIYPKIYFSLTRHEEWGSNLTLLVAMVILAIVRSDILTISMIFGGFIFGAIGWVIAIKLYDISAFPMKNGKFILGKLSEKNLVDGWKIMEFTLGAIGGFGLALTYCMNFDFIKKYNEAIALNGIHKIDGSFEKSAPFLCLIFAIGIVGVNLYSMVCEKKGKKANVFSCDIAERSFYNIFPMILLLLGSKFTAIYSTIFMLVFVLAVKCVFDRFPEAKLLPLAVVILTAICSCVFAGCFFPEYFSPLAVIITGTVPYLITEPICVIWRAKQKGDKISDALFKTSFVTMYPFMCSQSVLIIAVYLILL